jgi:hypothetical protein
MVRISSSLAILALLVPAAVTSAEGPTYTIRYQFQKGQTLDFEIEQQTTVASTVQEQSTEASVRNHSLRRWKVVDVDSEGVATIELSVLRVQMRSQEGNKIIEYDSDDPEKQPENFKALKEVIGKPISMVRIAPDGALLEEKPLVKAEGIATMQADQILPLLPEKPVSPGDSWRRKFEIRVAKPAERFPARQSFTLRDVRDGKATIKFKTTILAPIDTAALKAQLIQHRPSGTIEFDLERGLMLKQTQSLDETVVGVSGPASLFQMRMTATERLLDASLATNSKSGKTNR